MRGKYDFVLEDGEATIESFNPAVDVDVEWICMGRSSSGAMSR